MGFETGNWNVIQDWNDCWNDSNDISNELELSGRMEAIPLENEEILLENWLYSYTKILIVILAGSLD